MESPESATNTHVHVTRDAEMTSRDSFLNVHVILFTSRDLLDHCANKVKIWTPACFGVTVKRKALYRVA